MLQNPHLSSKNANNEIYSLASTEDHPQLKEIQDLGYNKGKAEGKIESIKELMRNLNLSPKKAMKALGITPSEFGRYLALF